MKRYFFFAFLFSALAGSLFAQENRGAEIETLLKQYSVYYLDSVSNQASVFSGKVQQPVQRRTESLYLRERGIKVTDSWGQESYPVPLPPLESYSAGTLLYDGTFYENVQMRLDLYRDELVLLTPNRISGIILEPERTGYADLRGYRNIYIRPGDAKYRLPAGYYQIVYSGRREVLKKETFQYNLSDNTFVNRSISYYIEKDGIYHRVKGRKGPVLRVLREHRREIDRSLKQAGISFKEDPENAIRWTMTRYDELNQQAGL